MLVRRPMRPPLGIPDWDVLRPTRFTDAPLPLGSLFLRSRARRRRFDWLGRRLSAAEIGVDDGGVWFLSMISDVDDRRRFGGELMLRKGELVCERVCSVEVWALKYCEPVLSMLLRWEAYGDCGNAINVSSSSLSTVSIFRYGARVMLVLLDDAVTLLLLLLAVLSLLCLFFMLE